jgi:hypothetical protein
MNFAVPWINLNYTREKLNHRMGITSPSEQELKLAISRSVSRIQGQSLPGVGHGLSNDNCGVGPVPARGSRMS